MLVEALPGVAALGALADLEEVVLGLELVDAGEVAGIVVIDFPALTT